VQTKSIEATIFFRHTPAEVYRLSQAIIPLGEQIRAVSNGFERGTLKLIISAQHFRSSEAERVCRMLRRAAKYARRTLDNYFPLMRQGIIAAAEELEEAVDEYEHIFTELRNSTVALE
jgi:hypothetical protein